MQRVFERIGVWGVIAVVAVVVVAYSLWGASIIKAQHAGAIFSTTNNAPLTTTL